ncbi:MAG: DUF2029 domain-containing protein [Solirubrobacterales bacterium]|nr:DUF2029 domain-containing protein [Solirubrobacterales bacterium]
MNRPVLERAAWPALGVSCIAYVLVSLAHHQAFHPWGRLGFFDLKVYRGAAQLVLHGRSVYGGPIWRWAPFTYPPFAALVLAPLGLLPLNLTEVLVTVLGIVALFAIMSRALQLPEGRGWNEPPGRRTRSALAALATAAALWLEPVTSTLGYGQVNLLIALLVVGDLSRPDGAGSKGALIGIAAGLKLTPLIFVPYLLVSRRTRAGCVALGTFAATVLVGYAALPGDSRQFWGGGLFLDPRRVGGCCVPANQSLRGLILRLDPAFGSGRLFAITALVALLGIALAAAASRRGDEATGFSLCALTGLLVSPVSWTHHWALAVPALLLLGVRAIRARSKLGMAAFAALLLVGYSYLPKLMAKPALMPSHRGSPAWAIAAAPYVSIGLVVLALALVAEAAARTRRLSLPAQDPSRHRGWRPLPAEAASGPARLQPSAAGASASYRPAPAGPPGAARR